MLSHGLGDPTMDNALEDLEYQVAELDIDAIKFYPGNPVGSVATRRREDRLPVFRESCRNSASAT